MSEKINPMYFPIFRILLSYGVGIIFGILYSPARFIHLFACMQVILILFLIVYLINYKRINTLRFWYLPALAVYLFFILAGIYNILLNDPRTHSDYFANRRFSSLLITADEPGYNHGRYLRFKAIINGGFEKTLDHRFYRQASGLLMVSLKDTSQIIKNGDVLLIPNTCSLIPGLKNPAGFDYAGFENNHQIYHQCLIPEGEIIRLQGRHSIRSWAFYIQAQAGLIINKNIKNQAAASFLDAMIAGLRSNLPAQLYTAFSRTGTVHIISISGMHVQIVYFMLGWLVFFLKKSKYRTLRTIRKLFLISTIWLYAMISGFSPAVCRCALAITLMILTENFDRKVAGPLMLSLSAFLLLLIQPWLLADMGFQLSYLAVAGLHLFQSGIYKLINFPNRLLRQVWNLCSTSIAAQVLTFPLCLYYFHQFPVYFLFANLLIIPLTGLILYVGLALLVFSLIPFLEKIIILAYNYLYQLMSWLLDTISNLPGSVVENIYPGAVTISLIMLLILVTHSYITTKKIKALREVLVICCLIAVSNLYVTLQACQIHKILFLDTQKANGLCFLDGTNAWLMGPKLPDSLTYERIYKPALASMNILHVHLMGEKFHSAHLQVNHNLISFYAADLRIVEISDYFKNVSGNSCLLAGAENTALRKNRLKLVLATQSAPDYSRKRYSGQNYSGSHFNAPDYSTKRFYAPDYSARHDNSDWPYNSNQRTCSNSRDSSTRCTDKPDLLIAASTLGKTALNKLVLVGSKNQISIYSLKNQGAYEISL